MDDLEAAGELGEWAPNSVGLDFKKRSVSMRNAAQEYSTRRP
jgi:hypothetical protein